MGETVELTGTITQVFHQAGVAKTGKNKGKPYVRHDILFSDDAGVEHRSVTFDADKAVEAEGLQGQRASITVEAVEREGYPPNYYFQGGRSLNGTAPQLPVVGDDVPKSEPTGATNTTNFAPVYNKSNDIRAQCAVKAAAMVFQGREVSSEALLDIARDFYYGILKMPETATQEPEDGAPSW